MATISSPGEQLDKWQIHIYYLQQMNIEEKEDEERSSIRKQIKRIIQNKMQMFARE